VLEYLRGQGREVEGLFYNPNIHPFIEFRRRLKALRVFLETDPLHVEIDEQYGLETWLRQARPLDPRRCERCYETRLKRTAETAKSGDFDAFTTTLLVSKHQQHDTVRQVGERMAETYGVPFLYEDMRLLADSCGEAAKKRQLYRQSYCGCVFSEHERYRDTNREVYRGPGGAKA
jgi:predicted adenine nucleotide alpha hydrolase (AANH) superfamily ATPase